MVATSLVPNQPSQFQCLLAREIYEDYFGFGFVFFFF